MCIVNANGNIGDFPVFWELSELLVHLEMDLSAGACA